MWKTPCVYGTLASNPGFQLSVHIFHKNWELGSLSAFINAQELVEAVMLALTHQGKNQNDFYPLLTRVKEGDKEPIQESDLG